MNRKQASQTAFYMSRRSVLTGIAAASTVLLAGRTTSARAGALEQAKTSGKLKVGIRPDALERIFERFYTDRPSGEAFGQNSGLGLSISRQIIEAHGGTLTAENIAGTKPGDIKGARFVVTLPAEG